MDVSSSDELKLFCSRNIQALDLLPYTATSVRLVALSESAKLMIITYTCGDY
jgi:hypothetical protein